MRGGAYAPPRMCVRRAPARAFSFVRPWRSVADMEATVLVVLLGGLAALAVLTFIVVAVVQVVREPQLPFPLRAPWIIVLLAAPVIGSLVWSAFGASINRRIAQDI